ncbi:MAG TPA: hypothetical protein VN700_13280 [Vicinamibacterales bacterium]|nr:hypothetical protein [Vicinamibacterales bacterium]
MINSLNKLANPTSDPALRLKERMPVKKDNQTIPGMNTRTTFPESFGQAVTDALASTGVIASGIKK